LTLLDTRICEIQLVKNDTDIIKEGNSKEFSKMHLGFVKSTIFSYLSNKDEMYLHFGLRKYHLLFAMHTKVNKGNPFTLYNKSNSSFLERQSWA